MKNKTIGVPTLVNGKQRIIEFGTNIDITDKFRSIMINHAFVNDEMLVLDEDTGRAKRVPREADIPTPEPVLEMKKDVDPVLQLINNAHKIKPASLEMSDV